MFHNTTLLFCFKRSNIFGCLRTLNANFNDIILVKNKSNRINVTANQQSLSYITLNPVDGYTPIIATIHSSHSATMTSDARIDGDKVSFHFNAKTAQTPETFTAIVVYVKNL